MTEPNINSEAASDVNDQIESIDGDDSDLFSSSSSSLAITSSESLSQKAPSDGRTVDANENEDLFEAKSEPAKAVDSKPSELSDVDLDNTATAVLPNADSAVDTLGTGTSAAARVVGVPLTVEGSSGDSVVDTLHAIEITVSDPKKIGDGMGAYIVYRVTTRTNIKHFKSSEMIVNRRFSDFLGLHEKLVARYQPRGFIIPPPPEKSVIGMTKVKVSKEESGSSEFVEKRRAALERFLNRVAHRPELCCDTDFVDFVELDDELPKAISTSSMSGAGFVRLLNRVGDSIGKFTYAMSEPDEWFEDETEELDTIDRELQKLHTSIEFLVLNRKDLSLSTQQFAKSVAVLGSTEEHMSLSRALSQLSEVEMKLYQLHADQADFDFFVLSELVKDYVCVIQSVRDVLQERVKLHRMWKDAEAALAKKQDERTKLEQQHKNDKLVAVYSDITDLQQRVNKTHDDFDEISETIRKEITRFDKQKVHDFKKTVVNYLECMLNYQQQIATCWETFLPEAKEVQ